MKIKAKVLITLIVSFIVMLLMINFGVAWWGYDQYQRELEQNQKVIQNTLNSNLQLYETELGFFRESIVQNKKFLALAKCYIRHLTQKSIDYCGKQTLGVTPEELKAMDLRTSFQKRMTDEANATFNYILGKNEKAAVFDLLFAGEMIWSLDWTGTPQEVRSPMIEAARETKASKYGLDLYHKDSKAYQFGVFAHFNPKEYFFSRLGLDFSLLMEKTLINSGADLVVHEKTPGLKIFSKKIKEENLPLWEKKSFHSNFEGMVDIQDSHFVYKVKIPLFGERDQEDYFLLIRDGRKEIAQSLWNFFWIGLAITLIQVVIVIILIIGLNRLIFSPLKDLQEATKDLAQGEGDLTRKIKVLHKDEIGCIAHFFNLFVDKLGDLITQSKEKSQFVSTSADQMAETAHQMKDDADQMVSNTTTVASAAEELNINIGSIFQSFGQVASNIENVSSVTSMMNNELHSLEAASEEFSQNLASAVDFTKEINKKITLVAETIDKTSKSSQEMSKAARQVAMVSSDASNLAEEVGQSMVELNEAVQGINSVIALINGIASQTTMLALNATIEATNAGEKGKGFAIVAAEVKTLAKQTTEATSKISSQIESIQAKANEVVKSVQQISQVNHQLSDLGKQNEEMVEEQNLAMVKAAKEMDEQSTDVQEIVRLVDEMAVTSRSTAKSHVEIAEGFNNVTENLEKANQETSQINKNMSEATEGVKEVTRHMVGLNQSAKSNLTRSDETYESANSLKKTSAEMTNLTNQFKT